MFKLTRGLVLMLVGFRLLHRAMGQDVQPIPPQAVKESGFVSRAISVSPNEEYRIGPKDVVEVYILRLPELSREYQVRSDGNIEMPFLGKIEAQKKTSAELATLITDRLRDGYLMDPQVSVIVKQISRKFFIQGALRTHVVAKITG